jgi:hypothetical protein
LIQSNAGITHIWSNGGYEKSVYIWKTITKHPKKSLKVALLPLWLQDDL